MGIAANGKLRSPNLRPPSIGSSCDCRYLSKDRELQALLATDPELERMRVELEQEFEQDAEQAERERRAEQEALRRAEQQQEASLAAGGKPGPQGRRQLAGSDADADADDDDADIEAMLANDPDLRSFFDRLGSDSANSDDGDSGTEDVDMLEMIESIDEDPSLTSAQKIEAKLAIQGMYNAGADEEGGLGGGDDDEGKFEDMMFTEATTTQMGAAAAGDAPPQLIPRPQLRKQ